MVRRGEGCNRSRDTGIGPRFSTQLTFASNQAAQSAQFSALSGLIFIKPTRQDAKARESVSKLQIRASSIEQRVSRMSGGNQQKVLFAKWLARNPKVLIADEPTRGIDVGAKAEVHTLLRQLANQGAAVLLISSELPEILGMNDRTAVMREGRVVGIMDHTEATQERIAAFALGTNEDKLLPTVEESL